MTSEFTVSTSDELADALERFSETEIEQTLLVALRTLANRDDKIAEKQDELHRKMGLRVDHDNATTEELSEDEKVREVQEFLRKRRRTDPRLE